MSEILLKAEDARSAASDMRKAATEATDQFESLRGRLAPLSDSFRGQTAVAFDARYEEWRTSATQLIQALDSLGAFLDGAANAIEETDATLAQQLRNG